MRRILVLGASSYIGTFFQNYIRGNYSEDFFVEAVSLRGDDWKKMDWSAYDSVLNVVGKAHADIGKLTKEEKREYYEVNCQLACRAAKKAIHDGVGQYIYMSSVIVYGDSSDSKKPVVITRNTNPSPSNFYGDSKWKAEQKLTKLFQKASKQSLRFTEPANRNKQSHAMEHSVKCDRESRMQTANSGKVPEMTRLAILRPPMIYGAGCKGNYVTLEKFAQKLPIFPDYPNKRSMLYIENLCEFLCLLIKNQDEGLFFPQNEEYVKTSDMIRLIGENYGKKVHCLRVLKPAVSVGKYAPWKIGKLVRKAFGSLVYEKEMSVYKKGNYQRYSLRESVERTER